MTLAQSPDAHPSLSVTGCTCGFTTAGAKSPLAFMYQWPGYFSSLSPSRRGMPYLAPLGNLASAAALMPSRAAVRDRSGSEQNSLAVLGKRRTAEYWSLPSRRLAFGL